MSAYQLYCFAQSGNAYKAALMLELCEADWFANWVDFFGGEARREPFRSVNEMGEIPTLIHGTRTFTQSGVILDYLSHQFQRFGADNEDERLEILRWTLWDNHKLTANISTARFMQLYLAEKHRNPDVIAFLMGRGKAGLQILESRLNGRDWIAADRITTADLSCVGYMFFLEEIGINMADYPNIERWRNNIAALPRWKHPYELMPGHPLPERS